MKTIVLILTLATAVLLNGCARGHASLSETAAAEPTPACSFKEGVGLELTPAGANFIGLRTAELGEVLPREALLRTARGDFVYVANGPRLLRTPVKVGPPDARGFPVLDGLYEGDTIAVAGVRGLWLAELQAVNGGVGCADGH